jgi:hypothetical protein
VDQEYHRCLTKKGKGPRRSEGLSFCVSLLRAQEEKHEGEQNQRLNEGQSDEECELNTCACSGIPGQRFSHRASDPALAKSSQTCGKTHAQTNANRNGPVTGRRTARRLCVNRKCDQKDRNSDQQKKRKLSHFFLLIKLPPVGG